MVGNPDAAAKNFGIESYNGTCAVREDSNSITLKWMAISRASFTVKPSSRPCWNGVFNVWPSERRINPRSAKAVDIGEVGRVELPLQWIFLDTIRMQNWLRVPTE